MAHDSNEPEQVVRATITWRKNPREAGVIAYLDEMVVFPSREGNSPPEGEEGFVRQSLPEAGEEEDCVLHLSYRKTTYIAFPANFEVDNQHGFHFIPADDPEVTVIPAVPATVRAYRDGDSIVIRVTPL